MYFPYESTHWNLMNKIKCSSTSTLSPLLVLALATIAMTISLCIVKIKLILKHVAIGKSN